MELTAIQVVGYVASAIIAISMTMNSIVKFRWINLVGAITFSTYGFVLGAYPVGILNAFIVSVDLYYLYKIYSKKEVFETLEVRAENRHLIRFMQFHDAQIQKFFPGFSYIPEMNTVSFFILRDMSVAGIFLAHRINNDTLMVGLDYVIPEYRDFKNGRYVYLRLKKKFIESGCTKVVASGTSKEYIKYLKKLGFKENSEGLYEMSLV
jgi:hypothetical protein